MIKISFWMHIFHNNKICVQQNTAYNKKCDPHLALLYASDFYEKIHH